MRWTRRLLGLSVTVLFLWLICRKVDFAAVGAAVSNISGWRRKEGIWASH